MDRVWYLLMGVLIVLVGVGAPAHSVSVYASSPAAAGTAKKTCKTVIKKVHGKKKRVKVCHPSPQKPVPRPGKFVLPGGITLDRQGDVYVTDNDHRIQKLSPEGKPLAQWGTTGQGPGQFKGPIDVALDAAGNVFVVEYGNARVQELSPSGQPVAQWKTTGTVHLVDPSALALDPQGQLYVSDFQAGALFKIVRPQGQLVEFAHPGSGGSLHGYPVGVAVDAQGAVYTLDVDGTIEKLSATGQVLLRFGGTGTAPGKFDLGSDVTIACLEVDAAGNIYADDPENNRIQKFSPTGQVLAVWK